MTRLLRLEECAERTSSSVRWWRRAVFEKRIPVVKLGRLVRIAERDLEAFLAANREDPR
jgi:excisionase family DNA binding protein